MPLLRCASRERCFCSPARLVADGHVRSQGQLRTTVREWKSGRVSELVTFQGNGENPAFGVGKVIEVEGESGGKAHSYGRYRLSEINHWVQDDIYHNTFTALPASAEQPGPDMAAAPPMGVPELADVIDVTDPQHLGRIKVRFHWNVAWPQDAESGWLRVSTPYSGDGKGHLFTPEVGSQVLIGYERSLTDFPVVLGNLFHPRNKQQAKYTTPDNHLKGLQTAGGNKLVMSDKKGEQTILLSNSNNKDTAVQISFKGDGSIHIQSNGPVTVSGSLITLEAGDKGEINLHAKNISLVAENNLQATAAAVKIAGSQSAEISGQTLSLTAQTSAKLAAQTQLQLAGLNVEMAAQVITDIKAPLVKINS